MWKDLQIIIKGKISEEEEGSCSNPKEIEEPKSPVKEIKEPINPEKTTIQTIEQVNMANKVKSIIFPTTIKLNEL